MKEKMLLKLERDRLAAKNEALQKSLQNIEEKIGKEGTAAQNNNQLGAEGLPPIADSFKGDASGKATTKKKTTVKVAGATGVNFAPFPSDSRPNPYAGLTFEKHPYGNAVLQKTFKGHMMAISAIAMHPKRSICATASDDFTWKIWTLP